MNSGGLYRSILGSPATRRSIFVSYHHHGDRAYYDAFTNLFAATYDVLQDNSVEREIDSDNSEYVIRTIRDNYITGSSCTVVLCGVSTPGRKFVDWEIKATLDREHGLIGINLASNPILPNGNVIVPDRLFDNVHRMHAVGERETLAGCWIGARSDGPHCGLAS